MSDERDPTDRLEDLVQRLERIFDEYLTPLLPPGKRPECGCRPGYYCTKHFETKDHR